MSNIYITLEADDYLGDAADSLAALLAAGGITSMACVLAALASRGCNPSPWFAELEEAQIDTPYNEDPEFWDALATGAARYAALIRVLRHMRDLGCVSLRNPPTAPPASYKVQYPLCGGGPQDVVVKK